LSFNEAFKKFQIYVRYRHKKQGYYNIIKDFECRILPYFCDKDIYKISKLDLITWQNIILQFNFSNSYNKRLYYVFNLFLDYCVKYYDLTTNLLREIGPFPKKVEEKKYDYYTLKEFTLFIKNVDNIIYKQFFNFMYFTGCRPSETMALKFSDLQGKYININKSIQRKGTRELDTPKNKSSIRIIAIDNKLKRDLLHLKEYYLNTYDNFAEDYFIFGGPKPLAPTTIDRIKKKACNKAKLRVITQHQFRHSHATLLINNNIPINEVSRRLGHSNVNTTLNVYVHNDLSNEKRVLRTLNFQKFQIYVRNQLVSNILKHFSMF